MKSVECPAESRLQDGQGEDYEFAISILSEMSCLFLTKVMQVIKVKTGEFAEVSTHVVLRGRKIGWKALQTEEAATEKAQRYEILGCVSGDYEEV